MSDYGRYDDQTRSRSREQSRDDRGFSRNSDSIFSGFGGGGRGRDRDRGNEEMGARSGSGRTSSYDRDQNRGGGWNQERENLSWGRGSREHHDRDQNRGGGGIGGGRMREQGRGQGERMSSGWGDLDRDRHEHSRHGRDNERHYGRDDERGGLPIDETSRLIASNKVEGTAVYGGDGEKLGSVYNFMVNKFSGKVEYAVMGYGGFMGMGMRYYPLPWQTLTYDTDRGGYAIAMRERDLKDAPSFDRNSEPEFDQQYGERVHSWYGLNY